MPYHHHRLQFDFTLADVIRKLFPRPEVERQIEERRRDERRFMEQAIPFSAPITVILTSLNVLFTGHVLWVHHIQLQMS